MGVILHELATGRRPFASDPILFYHQCEPRKPLEIPLNDDFDEPFRTGICDSIHSMLQIEPSRRPKALTLAQSFSQYYELALAIHNAASEARITVAKEYRTYASAEYISRGMIFDIQLRSNIQHSMKGKPLPGGTPS